MNRKVYQNAFRNITVSPEILDGVLEKADRIREERRRKSAKRLKLLVPVALLLAASAITVSASAYPGVAGVLRDFYSQLFSTDKSGMDPGKIGFLEENGAGPVGSFVRNGVSLNVEGMIGDSNYLYLKYSISRAEKYDKDTETAFAAPKLYIGDMVKGILPAACSTVSVLGEDKPGRVDQAALYHVDANRSIAGETATFVMKGSGIYSAAEINLAEAYKKYGARPAENREDPYDLPDCRMNMPFNNEYGGKILLNSIGFVNNRLVLAVDSSGYYEIPEIFLRSKQTGRIYSRCDGYLSVKRNGAEYYPYEMESADQLEDFEIVMRQEYHFSFPLSYTDRTKELDTDGQAPPAQSGVRLESIRISPLSINIRGFADKDKSPIDAARNCSIRLKDKTVLGNFQFSYCDYGNADGSFTSGASFSEPVMLDSMETVIIEYGTERLEIPVKWKN